VQARVSPESRLCQIVNSQAPSYSFLPLLGPSLPLHNNQQLGEQRR